MKILSDESIKELNDMIKDSDDKAKREKLISENTSKGGVVDVLELAKTLPSEEVRVFIKENNKNKNFKIKTTEKYKEIINDIIENVCPVPTIPSETTSNDCNVTNIKIDFDINKKTYDNIMKGVASDIKSKEMINLENNLKQTIELYIESIKAQTTSFQKANYVDGYRGNDKQTLAIIKKVKDNFNLFSHNGYIFYYIIESVKHKDFHSEYDFRNIFEEDKNGVILMGENGEPIQKKGANDYITNKMYESSKKSLMENNYSEGYTLRLFTIIS